MDPDEFYIWFTEQAHNAYLMWVASWLAGGLGLVTILVSNNENNMIKFVLACFIIGGMDWVIIRTTHVIRDQIKAINEIKSIAYKNYLLDHRGYFSEFFVNDKGELCVPNRRVFLILHTIILGIPTWLIFSDSVIQVIISLFT